MAQWGRGAGDDLLRRQVAVVDALYSAATDPSRWQQVVGAISEYISNGPTGMLHRTGRPLTSQRLLNTNLDPSYADSYQRYYGEINPWAVNTRGARPPIQINDGWVAANELERSEYYADWARPLGMRYCLNVSVRLAPDETVEISTLRPHRMGPFDEAEIRIIESLVPHLDRALAISRRLSLTNAAQDASLQMSRRLGTGTLLVDANSRVAFMDAAAEQILASGSGLRIRGGRLEASPRHHSRLAAAIAHATGHGKTATGRTGALLTISGTDGGLALSVAVAPLDERDASTSFFGPLAMVLLSLPERSQPPDEAGLQCLFDLTPAEAKLVVALCAGETLATYSERSAISLNTVKTHLKHVFEKTGETRQADLVRRVSLDVALRRAPEQVR